MSEARKCDRCHGFYELPKEDQKNRDYPYYMKGAYVKIMLFDRYGEREEHDLVKNINEEYQKASEGIKTYADYKEDGDIL